MSDKIVSMSIDSKRRAVMFTRKSGRRRMYNPHIDSYCRAVFAAGVATSITGIDGYTIYYFDRKARQ